MDPDDISNATDTNSTYSEVDFYQRLFLELFTLAGLLSVTTNFFVVFVIIKYKKLRRDVTNIIIAHLSVLQAVYLFTTPLTMRVFMMLEVMTPLHGAVLCVLYELEYIVLFVVCLFQFLLTCDWYVKLYHEAKYAKFCHVYKFVVAVIYICGISLATVTTQFCLGGARFYVIALFLTVLAYICLVVFLIVMNVIHLFKKRKLRSNKRNVGLFIVNVFCGLWLPVVGLVFFGILGMHGPPLAYILFITLGLCSPVVNFLYLFYYDDNFNVFFKKVFTCQCNDYRNDILEDQSVTYNDVNGVQINKN